MVVHDRVSERGGRREGAREAGEKCFMQFSLSSWLRRVDMHSSVRKCVKWHHGCYVTSTVVLIRSFCGGEKEAGIPKLIFPGGVLFNRSVYSSKTSSHEHEQVSGVIHESFTYVNV